jgi:hypothetical protein
MQVWMKYIIGLSCCALIATACGTDSVAGDPDPETSNPDGLGNLDSDPADDPGQADQGASIQAAQGALPTPAISATGSSKMTNLASLAGSGLRIEGGTDLASYARGTYWIATGAMSATTEFTVNPAPGATFFYELLGSGTSYGTKLIHLGRVPGSNALQALATTGTVACGTLPSGQPTVVTLAFDSVARTFDVLIAGAPSACTDLPTKLVGPIKGLRMMDPGDLGYGGRVEFTNLALF